MTGGAEEIPERTFCMDRIRPVAVGSGSGTGTEREESSRRVVGLDLERCGAGKCSDVSWPYISTDLTAA
ncbi:hypothetical protein GUJ93_ZPchr0002g26354 [Zizania palustris]|uniref:Uncharacterized protein n=1 Tax=Zizania palustris TaxID=103762 RepID=A0A8J5SAC4_ZIZPA|nr:hypothetical protein GUJ93_ZPchr0002g26354 [Zizania palustris]